MSRHMTSREIAAATDTGRSTVNCLLHLYKQTGSVVKRPEISGRPRLLNSLDAAVRSFLFQFYVKYLIYHRKFHQVFGILY